MAEYDISYEFDPEEETGITVPKAQRREALERVAEYVKESMLSDIGEGKSPVAGEGAFPALSPAYKKVKGEKSSSVIPNLELEGDLLDSLEVEVTGSGIRAAVSDAQAPKADGHCNFSGKSKLPRRRFMPGEGQTFNRKIMAGVKAILLEYSEDLS
jgi:hypothetical protein